jgi:hypothetical protein
MLALGSMRHVTNASITKSSAVGAASVVAHFRELG